MRYTVFFNTPLVLEYVSHCFYKHGYEIFLVGGCIRDMIINRDVSDYDFTTDANPVQVQNIFSRTIPTGIEHGTVTVLFDKNQFQITTYRTEGKYSNFRSPDEVQFSKNLLDDLSRRDFTINALAYDLHTCALVDEFEGVKDIEKKIIRTVGNSQERFQEDALRMLRACRFSCQLGFSIEKSTFLAIQKLCANILKISMERIREEWVKILQSKTPSLGITVLRESGLLEKILPELEKTVGVMQNKYHKYDVYEHSLKTLDGIKTTDYRVRMAGLLHDIAKPQTKEFHKGKKDFTFYGHESVGSAMVRSLMKRIKFSNEDIYFVSHLVQHHMFHYTPEWTDGAVRKFVSRVGVEYLEPLFDLRQADRMATGMLKEEEDILLNALQIRIKNVLYKGSILCVANLNINGKDIMKHFKMQAGKKIGETLRYLLDKIQEDPTRNTKEILLNLSKDFLAM